MATTITSGVYETVKTWKNIEQLRPTLFWVNYNELTTSSLEIIVSKGNHPQMAELFRLVNYYNLPRLLQSTVPVTIPKKNMGDTFATYTWGCVRVGFSVFIYDEIFQERGLTCLTSWSCEMEPWESNFTRRSSTRKSPFQLVNNGLYHVYIVLFGMELSFLVHNFLQATTKRIWALTATQPPVGGAAPTNPAVGSVCMWRRPSTQGMGWAWGPPGNGETWWNMVKHGETWWNMVKHGETWWNMVKHGETSAKMRMMRWGLKIGQSWSI